MSSVSRIRKATGNGSTRKIGESNRRMTMMTGNRADRITSACRQRAGGSAFSDMSNQPSNPLPIRRRV